VQCLLPHLCMILMFPCWRVTQRSHCRPPPALQALYQLFWMLLCLYGLPVLLPRWVGGWLVE
jgi:hypothetical protein